MRGPTSSSNADRSPFFARLIRSAPAVAVMHLHHLRPRSARKFQTSCRELSSRVTAYPLPEPAHAGDQGGRDANSSDDATTLAVGDHDRDARRGAHRLRPRRFRWLRGQGRHEPRVGRVPCRGCLSDRDACGGLVYGQDLGVPGGFVGVTPPGTDRKSTRLNSSHEWISYAVFCLKKKKSAETLDLQSLVGSDGGLAPCRESCGASLGF